MTDTADSSNPQSHAGDSDPKVSTRNPETRPDDAAAADGPVPEPGPADQASEPAGAKHSTLREFALLAVIAVVLYYVMLTFVARPT